MIYLLSILTFGIYGIYWFIATKNEMNEQGAKIPTAWLLVLPIVNIYWSYKYCEGFSTTIKKDNNAIVWFLVYMVVGFVMPAIIQSELNKLAKE